MGRTRHLLGLAALLLALGTAAPAQAADPLSYVVALEPGTDVAAAEVAEASVGVHATSRYHGAVAGFAAQMTPAQAMKLADQPGVLFVEPDKEFVGVGKGGKPAPPPVGEIQPPGIRRVGGLKGGLPRGAAASGVAIVDTGLALSSPELQARDAVNCISPGTPAQDDNGHGTSIAGVVGAKAGNGTGTIGVAPGTSLYSVKVLNKRNTGTLSQILCGMDWLAANAGPLGIKVVNMSIAATGAEDGNCGRTNGEALHRAICALADQGILVVAAAGNASVPLEKTAPAAYAEVLTVTASADTDGLPGGLGAAPSCVKDQVDDRYAGFSNYASTDAAAAHTVAAPGVCVTSTGLTSSTSTYYGTSSAAPHAAAVAALCLDGPCAGATTAEVVARLRADALTGAAGFLGDPLRPISGRYYGPLLSAGAY